MRLPSLAGALLWAALARADVRSASIYIQPVGSDITPSLLAEIQYDVLEPASAEVSSYEAPELPEDASLVRIGIYDTKSKSWISSTSVASVDNFGKGYSPHFVLSVDGRGNYLGASFRGVAIDAGVTRDFGPQVAVIASRPGKQPELNKPVVLSPEGKTVQPPEEKTLLQRYLHPPAVFLADAFADRRQVLVGYRHCGLYGAYRRWRPEVIELSALRRGNRPNPACSLSMLASGDKYPSAAQNLAPPYGSPSLYCH